MVVLRDSGYAIEIEIKISASDIMADVHKKHTHDSDLFRQLYFAVPAELAENKNIPEKAGILSFDYNSEGSGFIEQKRAAKVNRWAQKISEKQKMKLASLGCERMWSRERSGLDLAVKNRKAE